MMEWSVYTTFFDRKCGQGQGKKAKKGMAKNTAQGVIFSSHRGDLIQILFSSRDKRPFPSPLVEFLCSVFPTVRIHGRKPFNYLNLFIQCTLADKEGTKGLFMSVLVNITLLTDAETYRVPMPITAVCRYPACPELFTYPLCPKCIRPIEQEYQLFCNHCGQALDWTDFSKAVVVDHHPHDLDG